MTASTARRLTPGEAVRRLRLSAEITQAELARRAGISTSLMSDIERGNRTISLRTRRRLAEALGVDPEVIRPLAAA